MTISLKETDLRSFLLSLLFCGATNVSIGVEDDDDDDEDDDEDSSWHVLRCFDGFCFEDGELEGCIDLDRRG